MARDIPVQKIAALLSRCPHRLGIEVLRVSESACAGVNAAIVPVDPRPRYSHLIELHPDDDPTMQISESNPTSLCCPQAAKWLPGAVSTLSVNCLSYC